jgi:ketosteroid isomerase-like protein
MVPQSAQDVVTQMCRRYSEAVNASDAKAYSGLFADDAIWMPPGGPTRHGPAEIEATEGADYEQERLVVAFTPDDSLEIDTDWVYGIALVEGKGITRQSGAERAFKFRVSWLINRVSDGSWAIRRQMWNHRP